ncbi:MAG: HEAT repeat domain-containing protein [Thermoanaerobaculia bacterium]
MPHIKANAILILILVVGIVGTGFYLDYRADRNVARLAERKDVSGLIELHNDSQQGHKNSARHTLIVRALGDLGDRRAAMSLMESLRDPRTDPTVRAAAAEALGKLKDPSALPTLRQTLNDDIEQVRTSAETAIANYGSTAKEPLVGLLTDWTSSRGAARVLEKLGWVPATDEDRVHFWIGLRNTRALKENQDLVLRVLRADWSRDEYTLFALISLGHAEDIPMLIETLRDRGNKSLAEAYLNSGSPELAQAAQEWAKANSYEIKKTRGGSAIAWGRMR